MDFKFIDTHLHVGHEHTYMTYDTSVKALIAQMDRLGFECALNLGTEGLRDEYAKGIAVQKQVFEESGGRIYPCYNYGPLHPDAAIEEIRKNYPNPIFKGIKILPVGCAVDADDDRYEAAWKLARELKLPIIGHSWAVSSYHPSQQSAFAGRYERFISAYPDVTFVFAHSGGRWGGLQAAARIGRTYKNTYFDIAGDIWGMDVLEYLVDNVSADHVLFASDYSMIEQRPMIGVVLGSSLSASEKRKVLRENALGLFFPERA